MRTIALLAVLLAASPARAEGFLEILGGIMIPVQDEDWTNYVESGPKIGVRAGSVGEGGIGAMLSVDWTPITEDDSGWAGFGNSVNVSSHRFRILINAATHYKMGGNLTASFRFGGGIDIAYVSVETNIFGVRSEDSDTDPGLAIEAGAGLWFNAGKLQVGGELGLPMSFHADGEDNNIDINDYTSLDIDILFGVRILSP